MQGFLSRLVPKAGSFAVFSFFDTLEIVIKIVFPVGSSLVTGVDHDR